MPANFHKHTIQCRKILSCHHLPTQVVELWETNCFHMTFWIMLKRSANKLFILTNFLLIHFVNGQRRAFWRKLKCKGWKFSINYCIEFFCFSSWVKGIPSIPPVGWEDAQKMHMLSIVQTNPLFLQFNWNNNLMAVKQ